MTAPTLSRGERGVLATGGLLLGVTALWWAFALGPVPGGTPAWLARARLVCFGAGESGLPDAGGWLLLIGQPLGMFGLLVVGWSGELRSGLRRVVRGPAGRAALAALALAVTAGLGLAARRVVAAAAPPPWASQPDELPPAGLPRVDRPAPADALVDQDGRSLSPGDLRGGPVLVTFAFGHCSTVCPVVVQRMLAARARLAEAGMDVGALVVTLDPWRDTPSRLPHLARQWGVPPGVHVLSGPVEAVERALDAWEVPRTRDPLTGDVTHPALVYIVDSEGVIAYASTGGVAATVELTRRTLR